jgi:O-antigen/teichoic acid export membrane protein
MYAVYSWWLTRHLGINGAASAKLLSAVIDSAFLWWFAWKLKAFSIRDCVSGPLLKALLTSAGMVVAVCVIGFFQPPLSLAVPCLVGCFACYAVTFWVAAVDNDDRLTIRTLSRQLLVRRPAASS